MGEETTSIEAAKPMELAIPPLKTPRIDPISPKSKIAQNIRVSTTPEPISTRVSKIGFFPSLTKELKNWNKWV